MAEKYDRGKIIQTYAELLIKASRNIENPVDIWLIGNTGMRNPWRIPSGFKVYAESNMVGKLRSQEEQVAFKMLLMEKGEIGGDLEKDQSASITRKYRLMFNKCGFTYPEMTKKSRILQADIGPIDGITPLGEAFYAADTVSAQQECFLRGLIVPMEKMDEDRYFSPLLWVLAIMIELEKKTGDTKINFVEFASLVQTSNPKFDIDEVTDAIIALREDRKKAENKKRFDNEAIGGVDQYYRKLRQNFKDYADMNIRYLISSGIVKRAGRGITLVPEYHSTAIELVKGMVSSEPYKERLIRLCEGAELPTDNKDMANAALKALKAELDFYNVQYTIPDIPLDNAQNINMVRASLKQNIDHYKEEQYAIHQVNEWQEIYEYMQLLIVNNGREKEIDDDNVIRVPKSEAAAYLEWILWRAFLAIDHLVNKPYDARGFKIDQDYLPVGTAPGGGPDMIFEFEDYIIVVEVTMSTNSRQEAMEGEPVRRHVADRVMSENKPVYGVFVANRIDSNTAETFRIGVWYNNKDERMALRIVPFTLRQFAYYFKFMFESGKAAPDYFLVLFKKCFDAKEGKDGPEWKEEIERIITNF